MAFLVRKITRSKWPRENGFHRVEDIDADAVTGDLRTTFNKLSLWRAETEDEIREIGVSICSVAKTRQARIDLALLSYEDLSSRLTVENSLEDATTAIPRMKDKHYNVCDLNCKSLCDVADMIARATSSQKDDRIVTIRWRDAVERTKEMREKGEVDDICLGDAMKKELNIKSTE